MVGKVITPWDNFTTFPDWENCRCYIIFYPNGQVAYVYYNAKTNQIEKVGRYFTYEIKDNMLIVTNNDPKWQGTYAATITINFIYVTDKIAGEIAHKKPILKGLYHILDEEPEWLKQFNKQHQEKDPSYLAPGIESGSFHGAYIKSRF